MSTSAQSTIKKLAAKMKNSLDGGYFFGEPFDSNNHDHLLALLYTYEKQLANSNPLYRSRLIEDESAPV